MNNKLNIKKKDQETIIKTKLNFLNTYLNITNIKNAINKVIYREMSDNEYMKNKDIMFDSKINQIIYFCKNDSYKNNFISVQNDENKLINFLEKYDYEHFSDEWQNEIIRLKTSIVDNNLMSNTPVKCERCNIQNVHVYSKQTRSNDEGETHFYLCLSCGHTWKDE